MYASGSGDNYFAGDLGIGVSNPVEKLEVAGNFSLLSGFMEFDEIASPTNPAANKARLYVKDSTGTTGLFFKDSAGTETELLAGGGINAVLDDTSPQLGGDLDLNSMGIDFPSTLNISDVLDEDNMASNSAVALATQQSIKAYVDGQIDDDQPDSDAEVPDLITVNGGAVLNSTITLQDAAAPTIDGRLQWDSAGEVIEVGDDGGGTLQFHPGAHTVDTDTDTVRTISKNSGSPLAERANLNFIEGANITITVTDDAAGNETDIAISASGGGGAVDAIEVEDGNDAGTFASVDTTARFEDSGDIDFVRVDGGAGGPDEIRAAVRPDSITPDHLLSLGKSDEFCLSYETTGDTWEWKDCSGGGGISAVVDDANPVLGGDFDLNGKTVSDSLGEATINDNLALIAGYIELDEVSAPPAPAADKGRLYLRQSGGETGLFFKDSAGTEMDLLMGHGTSNMPAARYHHSGVDDINAAATNNVVPWNGEDFEDGTVFTHDTSTDNSRITVSDAARYLVTGGISVQNATTSSFRYNGKVKFRVNNSTTLNVRSQTGYIRQTSGQTETTLMFSLILDLAAGDYFELLVDRENTTIGPANMLPNESSLSIVQLTGGVGPLGPTGSAGPTGAAGPGVNSGGSAGQVLSKIDSTDFNTQWADAVLDSDFSEAEGILRKTGSGAYEAIKSNLVATVAPTANDDVTAGYAVGSIWVDTLSDKTYLASDVTAGTAVWNDLSSGAGSNVSTVGIPFDNQIGVWTGDGTIEGNGNLTFDGTILNTTGRISLDGTTCLDVLSDQIFHDTNCDGVKDGDEEFIDQIDGGSVDWTDITNKPAGFDDDTDNEGIASEADPVWSAAIGAATNITGNWDFGNTPTVGGTNSVWHQGNDGTASSLDADLLDGQDGAFFRDWTNATNIPAGFADNVDDTGITAESDPTWVADKAGTATVSGTWDFTVTIQPQGDIVMWSP